MLSVVIQALKKPVMFLFMLCKPFANRCLIYGGWALEITHLSHTNYHHLITAVRSVMKSRVKFIWIYSLGTRFSVRCPYYRESVLWSYGGFFKRNYYSFKIFPQFWLGKSTRIIHHNQLLMTKFERILCLTRKSRQKCSLLQVKAPLTEKTWGRRWAVFVVKAKMADTSLVLRVRTTAGTKGEIMAKNIAKTARIQLGGRHLLFEEYLRSWTNLNVNYRR